MFNKSKRKKLTVKGLHNYRWMKQPEESKRLLERGKKKKELGISKELLNRRQRTGEYKLNNNGKHISIDLNVKERKKNWKSKKESKKKNKRV